MSRTQNKLFGLLTFVKMFYKKVRDNHGIVTVSSGFRCAQLSEAVGSKSTSAHCANGPDLVAAADFECIGSIGNYDLAVWISENLDFDQLILECYTKDADLPEGRGGETV